MKRKFSELGDSIPGSVKKVAFGTDTPSVLDVAQTAYDAYTNPVGYGLKVGYNLVTNQMLKNRKRGNTKKRLTKFAKYVASRPTTNNTVTNSSYVRRVKNYGQQSITRPELKTIDYTHVITPSWSTGVFSSYLLNGIANGTNDGERIGKRLILKSLHLRGMVYAANSTGNFIARMVIIYDKDNNGGSIPSASTVFTVDGFRGQLNVDQADRFQVIADNWFEWSSTYDPPKHYDLYIPMALPMLFGSSTAGITSINSGSLLLYVCSTGSNLSGDCSFTESVRVRYTDA